MTAGVDFAATRKQGKRGPSVPFKLVVLLLYGFTPGVTRLTKTKFLIQTGPFTDHLRVKGQYLRENLEILQKWGIVTDFQTNPGNIVVDLAPPVGWEEVV